jgi:hypothetical protein
MEGREGGGEAQGDADLKFWMKNEKLSAKLWGKINFVLFCTYPGIVFIKSSMVFAILEKN